MHEGSIDGANHSVRADDRNTYALAALRIGVGAFFTVFGEYKVFGPEFVRGGFQKYVGDFIQQGAYPFMVPLLKGIMAHGATAMAIAVAYGELLIGLSLLLGLLSRFASVFGCALMVSMWLSAGYPGEHAAFWMYWGASLDWSVFAVCFCVLAAGRPEEIWSVRLLVRPERLKACIARLAWKKRGLSS